LDQSKIKLEIDENFIFVVLGSDFNKDLLFRALTFFLKSFANENNLNVQINEMNIDLKDFL